MKYLLGFLIGLILASSLSIAQEAEILIPMTPIYPVLPVYPYNVPNYSLPPMPQPQWEHVSPC